MRDARHIQRLGPERNHHSRSPSQHLSISKQRESHQANSPIEGQRDRRPCESRNSTSLLQSQPVKSCCVQTKPVPFTSAARSLSLIHMLLNTHCALSLSTANYRRLSTRVQCQKLHTHTAPLLCRSLTGAQGLVSRAHADSCLSLVVVSSHTASSS